MTSKYRKLPISILLVIMVIYLFSPSHAKSDPTTKEGFLEDIRIAIETKNRETLSLLYNWDGVDEEKKSQGMMFIDQMIKYTLKSIEFAPLPKKDTSIRTEDGTLLRLNTRAEGLVKIVYQEEEAFPLNNLSYPYGIKNGKYCLPLYVPVK